MTVNLKLKTISILLGSAVLFTACSSSATSTDTTTHTERILESGTPISTFSSSEIVEETEETFPIRETEYVTSECDFTIDPESHHITATYDDGNYIIDYDLYYYDYGVTTVNIYSCEENSQIGQRHIDTSDRWTLIGSNLRNIINGPIMSQNYEDIINNTVNSADVVPSDEIPEISELIPLIGEKYNLDTNVSRIVFNFSDFINSGINFDDMGINILTDNQLATNLTDTINGDITLYTLRETIDGLPVGIPGYSFAGYSRIRYGEFEGSTVWSEDVYWGDFYDQDNEIIVDIRNYNLIINEAVSSNLPVMPLEECIQNSINGAIHDAFFLGSNHAQVFAAELVYFPFEEGCSGALDFSYNTYMCPFWVLHVVSSGDDVRTEAILLNAVTGELVSYGL